MLSFLQGMQLGFEIVMFQGFVSHSHAQTILTETGGKDTQRAQHLQQGRGTMSVTFQLNYSQVLDAATLFGVAVMEPQSGVNGHPFGKGPVYQRHPAESVLQGRL
jgi:hypothetical protein